MRGLLDRLSREDPDFKADIRSNRVGQSLVMNPFEVDPEADIVRTLVAAHRQVTGSELKVGDVAPYKFYGTDASHLARAGMIGVVYGPGGAFNTMPDERVALKDLKDAARVYARTIVQTCL